MAVQLGTKHDPKVLTETEAAYLAAFVDGEGHIMIYCSRPKGMNRPYYGFRMGVTNTDFGVLESLQEMTGCGTLAIHTKNHPDWKDAGLLQWQADHAATILMQILPYMRIKRLQADVALRFMAAKRRASETGADTHEEQAFLYAEMKRLNRRGKSQQKATAYKRAVRRDNEACAFSGCTSRKHYGRGYCRKHYRWAFESLTFQDREDRTCEFCGEALSPRARIDTKFCGVSCKMKWHRRHGSYSPEGQKGGRVCGVEGCARAHHSKGLCRRHYMQKWHAKHSLVSGEMT